jgi:riboflavin synthase
VNGACLTLVASRDGTLEFDVVPETLARTNLGTLKPGDTVNLEASLRIGDALGGHLVYGHVDATTNVLKKMPEGPGFRMWCSIPPGAEPMIVAKGYVALDGISLTVAEVAKDRRSFAVALIPETLGRTTLGTSREGAVLNFEADPIARYVAGFLNSR